MQASAGGALIGIKCAGIRIGSGRCGSSQCTTIHACTLEAMRTQASPDLCAESKWLIAFNCNSHRLHLSKLNRAILVQHCASGTVISMVSYSLLLFARTVG